MLFGQRESASDSKYLLQRREDRGAFKAVQGSNNPKWMKQVELSEIAQKY